MYKLFINKDAGQMIQTVTITFSNETILTFLYDELICCYFNAHGITTGSLSGSCMNEKTDLLSLELLVINNTKNDSKLKMLESLYEENIYPNEVIIKRFDGKEFTLEEDDILEHSYYLQKSAENDVAYTITTEKFGEKYLFTDDFNHDDCLIELEVKKRMIDLLIHDEKLTPDTLTLSKEEFDIIYENVSESIDDYEMHLYGYVDGQFSDVKGAKKTLRNLKSLREKLDRIIFDDGDENEPF